MVLRDQLRSCARIPDVDMAPAAHFDLDNDLVFTSSQTSQVCASCFNGSDSPSGLSDGSLLRMVRADKCEMCNIMHFKNYADCAFKAKPAKCWV